MVADARGEVEVVVRDNGVAVISEAVAACLVSTGHGIAHNGEKTVHVHGPRLPALHGRIEHAGKNVSEGCADDVILRDKFRGRIPEAASQIDDVEIERNLAAPASPSVTESESLNISL